MASDNSDWSEWLPLTKEVLVKSVPVSSGVYQIRPIGADSAGYIGSGTGKGGLKQRIGQRIYSPDRYLSPFEKKLVQIGLSLEFRFIETAAPQDAKQLEAVKIQQYAENHKGKLPPGNIVKPKL